MNNIKKVGLRNKINVQPRRYALSDLVSESYKVLYECESGSNLYKLTESHIDNLRKNPENLSALSKDLCILKGLVSLGESALIKDSDLTSDVPAFTNDMKLNQKKLDTDRDVEQMDDADVINEEEDIIPDEEDDIVEEEDIVSDEEDDIVEEDEFIEPEEDVIEEEEDCDDEITNDELVELKKHLKEMRRARRMKEAKKPKAVKESRSWKAEKSSMSVALKHFRESSTNKAFYNTFSKMSPRLKDSKPLTIQESLLLYKASNSAMTQLAIELERNPEFIYTFRECTSILSEDTKSLLECIKKHKAPSRSLVESLRAFSDILLESEEEPEDYEDYEEEEVTESEEIPTEPQEPEAEESIYEEDEIEDEIPADDELEEEEELSDEVPVEDEIPAEDELEEEEELPVEDEIPAEEVPTEDELEEDDDTEITDEEAEALKKKLDEIRKRKARR